ncbi:MAG TPA: hypothetical protein VIU12_27260 [Chryseolinea sp.]
MRKAKKRPFLSKLVLALCLIAAAWLILTIWVERLGPAKAWHFSSDTATKKVLIVFDPDPIYNLDEQVCLSLAKGLSKGKLDVTIETVAAVDLPKLQEFDAYVFCANTYNWAPDWAISDFIQSQNLPRSKPVVAITVGSGSTRRAQLKLEEIIAANGAPPITSSTWWLMRPNNEKESDKRNVDVAVSLAYTFGIELAYKLKN